MAKGIHEPLLDFSEPAIRNHGLFADHFLDERLPRMVDARDHSAADAIFDTILAVYETHAPGLVAANEAQTEHDFVQPVLDALWGRDCYDVQAGMQDADGRRQPDYAFFLSPGDRALAATRRGQPDYWHACVVLGDAKAWDVSLDRRRNDGTPSAQITGYLFRAGVRFGILTNGRTWRLYEKERSHAGGIWFEVLLDDILKRKDREAFRRFFLFFSRAAFEPDETGVSFLDRVLKGSEDYAIGVGERLKEAVYDAMSHLMNGFFSQPTNRLDPANPEHVRRDSRHFLTPISLVSISIRSSVRSSAYSTRPRAMWSMTSWPFSRTAWGFVPLLQNSMQRID